MNWDTKEEISTRNVKLRWKDKLLWRKNKTNPAKIEAINVKKKKMQIESV